MRLLIRKKGEKGIQLESETENPRDEECNIFNISNYRINEKYLRNRVKGARGANESTNNRSHEMS